MRNPLNRRIPRDFKKNFLKYFGMMIILIVTICIGSSFQSTMNAATAYLEDIKEGNFQEDGFIEVREPLTDEMISHFEDEGFWVEENFYATEREFPDSTKIYMFNERTKMDIPTLFEGRMPGNDTEIALDHVFSRNRSIKIGDTVSLLNKDYTVCGTVSLPDYSSLFMNNSDLVMNTQHFCVSVLAESGFDEISKDNITYRYSYRYTDRELTTPEKNEKAEEAYKNLYLNGVTIDSMLDRNQNQSITFLEMDIGTDGPIMNVFVYILVAMIAFIFAILTNNTIERESVIIGTLRSMGYRKWEIIVHYLQPTIIVAFIGCVVGNILGYTVMIKPFLNIYYTTYSIGPLKVEFDVPMFILTTVLPVVIMVVINCWMLAKKLSLSPLKFLRRELKKNRNGKNVKLPNVSFINRFRLRVIIRNKGSFFMLFFGIFFASFMLMFGIGLEPLMNHYTEDIDNSLPYDYQYLIKAPVQTDKGEKVLMYEMDDWFNLGKKDIGITIYGIESDSRFFKEAYISPKGNVSAKNAEHFEPEVAVSSAYANKMNLKEGDILNLTDKNTDKEYSFEVGKIYPYEAAMAIFTDKSELTGLLDMDIDAYNCILSNEKIDIDESLINKVIVRDDLLGAANQMISSFATVINFVKIFSIIVYMVVLYIITKVVIEKNAVSISYMKVFGYKPKEIRKLYLTTAAVVAIVSLIVCIPLEIQIFKGVLIFLSSMIEGYISFYLPIWVYIEIVAVGIIAYFCINRLHVYSVNKIPMTDALKNRE